MDLAKFDTRKTASEGVAMVVRHPQTDEPLVDEKSGRPVTITLLGEDSDVYKQVSHRSSDERLKKRVKKGRIEIRTAEIERDALEVLVACTKDWDGIVLDGQGLEFTPDNARKLYTRIPFVRDQAAEFINDRANFLGNS